VEELQQLLRATTVDLKEAQDDLQRDEMIFENTMRELHTCRQTSTCGVLLALGTAAWGLRLLGDCGCLGTVAAWGLLLESYFEASTD
jgi:hypothetical protein